METTFKGKYFNGTSSKPYLCDIHLDRSTISISILNDDGNVQNIIHWEPDFISKDDIHISDKARLKYGKFPYQTLEIQGKEFWVALRETYPHHSFAKRDTISQISKNWKLIVSILLVLLGFGIFSFKVIIPNLAEYAATKVPFQIEKTIGESAYNQITALTSENDEKSKLVQEFFDAMNYEKGYDYTITVLNSETVNAFAVPGGRIAVYNGILTEIESAEELAALLSHESAHIELQHSLKSIFRSLSSYFIISLLFGDMGGITAVVFENIYMFQDLQYSRTMEKEADMRGIKYMKDANINPNGMLELFNTLKENSSTIIESNDFSEFVSTHPLTKHRIKYISEYLQKNTEQYPHNQKLDSLWNEIRELE